MGNSWISRDDYLADRFAADTDRALQKSLGAGTDLPPEAVAWLARLRLLYGVPLDYLVPDIRLLPVETIRFFMIDRNWTDRMVDGAISIAANSSRHSVANILSAGGVYGQVDLAEPQVRPGLRGKPVPDAVREDALVSGFLLRSAAVSGWPGIEVAAYADKDRTQALDLLRIDRLTPDILLCLFGGSAVPYSVVLNEPPETLHFGVQTVQGQRKVYLRSLGAKDIPVGQQLPDKSTADVVMRGDGGSGVIDVAATRQSIAAALQARGQLDPALPFAGADLAIEMVRSAGQQAFQHGQATLPPAAARNLTFYLRGQA